MVSRFSDYLANDGSFLKKMWRSFNEVHVITEPLKQGTPKEPKQLENHSSDINPL